MLSSPIPTGPLWVSPILLFSGYRKLFPWDLERPKSKTFDSSAEERNDWSCIPTPQYTFTA